MIRDFFEQLRSTASANTRKELMKTALEGDQRELIIEIFQDCYGPAKYNTTSAAVTGEWVNVPNLVPVELTIDNEYSAFHELLIRLSTREYTGLFANQAIEDVISSFVVEDRRILLDILDKNLKVGFSLEQVNKLLGKKAKEFECSLAFNLDDVKGVNPIDGTFYASVKLDGCRNLCFVYSEYKDGHTIVSEPVFKSRQNKEFTTLDKLKEPVKRLIEGYHLTGWIVLDGEVCILDEEGHEHFDWIMKEIRRKDHTIEHPCYNIFDVLTLDEFEGRTESPIFSTRNFYLLNAFHHMFEKYGRQPELKLLKQELITSQEDFDRWSQYVTERGWEGFMLRKDAPYRSGRTKDLLKVKKFKDAEYVVTGYERGDFKYGNRLYPDIVSSLHIIHKGNRVCVGSGISKEQRILWAKEPDKIIGKTITVQYFEETQDKRTGEYSLRFPILKYVYEKGRDV